MGVGSPPADEDGLSWGPSSAQKADNQLVQAYIDSVVGPTAEALYGAPPL